MRPTYSPEAEAFREKVQAFLAEQLPSNWAGAGKLDHQALAKFTRNWRATLHEHGYLALSWPAEYGGGGLSALEQVIVAEEFAKAGVPSGGGNDGFGIQMLGNTLLNWGTEEQKQHYLPRILSGEDPWCQGYSEPNAGSDLGGLGCRAVLDGDQWVINGQKIWTSGGHLADHIFVLARTDPDAPKHKGISFLLVRMDQPGVEVRPIKMISGDSEFNEVFFTDATCPRDDVVGGVNNGWGVAMTLLGYERGAAAATDADPLPGRARPSVRVGQGARRRRRPRDAPAPGPVLRRCADHAVARHAHAHRVPRRQRPRPGEQHLQGVLERVPPRGHRAGDGHPRSGRAGAERSRPSSAFQTDDSGAPNSSASWATTFLTARAETIYAGTSQIQRNILGERVLGLPKEPA